MKVWNRFRNKESENVLKSPVEQKISATYPNVELEYADRFLSRRGEVVDLSNSVDKTPVYVGEGSVIVANSDRELYTDKMFSCIGVFIKGNRGNSLAHMTRDKDLAYSQSDKNKSPIDIILDSTRSIGETIQIVIIEPKFFEDQADIEKALASIEQGLRERNIRVRREKFAMTGLGVYYSPQKPNEILVFGKKVSGKEPMPILVSSKDEPDFKFLKL